MARAPKRPNLVFVLLELSPESGVLAYNENEYKKERFFLLKSFDLLPDKGEELSCRSV